MNEICEVGPGGNYLTSPETLKKFRAYQHTSRIWPTLSLESWEEKGRLKASKELRKYTNNLVDELIPPEDNERLIFEGERILKREIPD